MTFSSIEREELDKYQAVWNNRGYADQADGDPCVIPAWHALGCKPEETMIDWGCGSGKPAKKFQDMGLQVTGFDVAFNCLDPGVDVKLVIGFLWNPPKELTADYSFSTDVLEHIPPERLDECMDVLRDRTRKAGFFQVDTFPDISGPKMNPPRMLHLSLHSAQWWLNEFKKRWPVVRMTPGTYTRWRYLCLK